jgi:hypothetical protein
VLSLGEIAFTPALISAGSLPSPSLFDFTNKRYEPEF